MITLILYGYLSGLSLVAKRDESTVGMMGNCPVRSHQSILALSTSFQFFLALLAEDGQIPDFQIDTPVRYLSISQVAFYYI